MEMVNAIHDAGMEVLLDVVYNHTGEGDRLGSGLQNRESLLWQICRATGSILLMEEAMGPIISG